MLGETEIDAVVAPPGVHKYVGLEASVVAVRDAEPPGQIVAEFTVTLGSGLTVTVPDPEFAQPVTPSVTVHV